MIAKQRPAYAEWLQSTNNISQQFLAFGSRADVVSLAGGLPAAELYPVAAIQAATERALARHGTAALEYGAIEGFPGLRQLIAARVSAETGGTFTAANVLVTTGSMQALDLIGKVLLDTGDLIVAQSPAYLGALDSWRPRGPRYHKLDWDGEDAGFTTALAQAKFVYCVPNYSNPTGVLVSPPHGYTSSAGRSRMRLLPRPPCPTYCALRSQAAWTSCSCARSSYPTMSWSRSRMPRGRCASGSARC